jgi:DNA topoisomerase-3
MSSLRLFIAEKPSLGRAIAAVLPKPHKKEDGYIVAANGDTVSWCIGHLLEQQEPEAYHPDYKKWSHDHLPIVPELWKLKVKHKTAKQVGVLRKLIKQAETLVHAGDPDREGQLLVDELIHFIDTQKNKPVLRCLVNDLNPAAVSKAVNALRQNSEFRALSTSALARSRADWLYGINLTRAYTLQGKAAGYTGVLSVGRVQTPILGLVVRRDLAIDSFISQPFYEVWAQLITANEETFQAKWQPSESCKRFLDDQGRNLSKPLAENVARRISDQAAEVKTIKREHKKISAPLPYSLSALQIDAGKAFGMSAKQVLDICQTLYERHKAITYPRSDCRYLPTEHHPEAPEIYSAVCSAMNTINQATLTDVDFNFKQKTRAWNDKEVSAHHAIIPTKKSCKNLTADEQKIYQLVARNYLAQFLPKHEYSTTTVHVDIAGGDFKTTAKETLADGWQVVFPKRKSNNEPESLPRLTEGQSLQSEQAKVTEKHTTPPAYYTDATLLAAMTGIASHVKDSGIRKILKDTDGLGTEATRASIIELLFKRGFLQRKGKTITATTAGRAFIEALPEALTLPDMTAQWESTLANIAKGQQRYEALMAPLTDALHTMTQESRTIIPTGLSGLGSAKSFRKRKGRKQNWKAKPKTQKL